MKTSTTDPVATLAALVKEAEAAGFNRTQIAEQMRAPLPLLSQWLARRTRPGAAYRDAIARWSRGRLPASAWLTEKERETVAQVRPFTRPRRAPGGSR